jgi:RNA polymerase sigma-70 factor (family 1)
MSEDIHNAQWVLSFQNGDQHAFRELYYSCYPSLYYCARIILKDKQESEQIVLESFVKLWDRRVGFESWGHIRAFLYTTTRNACFSLLKSNHRNQRLIEEAAMHNNPNELSAEEEMVKAEVMLEVYTAIEELPRECRDIFKLIFLEELTNAEIAEIKHIAVQTVRSQKAKALELLRIKLFKQWLRNG